jgi:hypothetical protein
MTLEARPDRNLLQMSFRVSKIVKDWAISAFQVLGLFIFKFDGKF